MIARLIGFTAATVFTGSVVTGSVALIAADMLGTEVVAKVWTSATTPSPRIAATTPERGDIVSREIERAKDITFFVQVPVSGHSFAVTTGTSFGSAADFEARKVKSRWCYAQIGRVGAVAQHLTLANQNGDAAPIYTDASRFDDDGLRPFGLSASEAGQLARSHCRFGSVSTGGDGPLKSVSP